ncbi:uncharacterized protein LTR77_011203 [Saxophila tyrrhenica]|uniref:BTB domain-containing protein n=1 Tax=Saxophila tyrrhenica TaxID=1690608 RepID=A0AAV9NTH0_9PEZI|nr:hypothetical protein LTR77_011203 [Saxophila tyrrhenica]
MENIVVHPQGDVCFVARGATPDPQISFLVSSKVVCLASRPFAVLLGPNFHEGQTLAQAASLPIHIELPDDDAKGLDVVFKVLHHKAGTDNLPLPILAATARLVDKYQMQEVFHAHSLRWLYQHLRGSGTSKTLPEYLGIAFGFRLPAVQAIIAFGMATITGFLASAYGNASCAASSIRNTECADLVPYGHCERIDDYREYLSTVWTHELMKLVEPMTMKDRQAAKYGSKPLGRRPESPLVQHCNLDPCLHDRLLVPHFYQCISNFRVTGTENDPYPLLYHATRLNDLAAKLHQHPKYDDYDQRFTDHSHKILCTACDWLDDDMPAMFLDFFKPTIGRHRAMEADDLSDRRALKACGCGYSDTMSLLFGEKLPHTLEDMEKLSDFVCNQFQLDPEIDLDTSDEESD